MQESGHSCLTTGLRAGWVDSSMDVHSLYLTWTSDVLQVLLATWGLMSLSLLQQGTTHIFRWLEKGPGLGGLPSEKGGVGLRCTGSLPFSCLFTPVPPRVPLTHPTLLCQVSLWVVLAE